MAKVKIKIIKDVNKNLFRHSRMATDQRESYIKMMELFKIEMEREWYDEEKVILWSDGNSKTHMSSYSTMPGFTCIHNGNYPPCFLSGNCYALYDIVYPEVMRKCVRNTVLILKYPREFEKSFELKCRLTPSIRLHVEGDFIPSELDIVARVAYRNPNCKIMTYTKKYDMVNSYVEKNGKYYFFKNFVLIFSKWKGLEMNNPYDFPVCNVYDNVNDYVKSHDSRYCGTITQNEDGTYDFVKGNCAECFLHHVMGDRKGGCFDIGNHQSVAMLAH